MWVRLPSSPYLLLLFRVMLLIFILFLFFLVFRFSLRIVFSKAFFFAFIYNIKYDYPKSLFYNKSQLPLPIINSMFADIKTPSTFFLSPIFNPIFENQAFIGFHKTPICNFFYILNRSSVIRYAVFYKPHSFIFFNILKFKAFSTVVFFHLVLGGGG